MNATEQTYKEIERVIRKIAQKFPADQDTSLITDIHLRVSQDSGELLVLDDDENEITRCIVEQWIDNSDEKFYENITHVLRKALNSQSDVIDKMNLMKPFSFVLENDDSENVAELYVADNDTVIINGELMGGLEQDLDAFLDNLLKDKNS